MARVIVLLAAFLAWSGTASASTVEVKPLCEKSACTSQQVAYSAAAAETNDVEITVGEDFALVRDRVPIVARTGCVTEPDGAVRCTLDPTLSHAVRVSVGNRDDRASVVGQAITLMVGGPGDDVLVGTPDFINRFDGGPGDDRMVGGRFGDGFETGRAPDGSDTMLGASGSDGVSYLDRRRGVRADLEGDRDDGEPGERDRIGSDVENLEGTNFDDALRGGAGRDNIYGWDGRDVLRGGGGPDHLVGDNWIVARPRAEDRLFGGSGEDVLSAGAGADLLHGGHGGDWLVAGQGADRLLTADGAVDGLLCEAGRDRAAPDRSDFVAADCERSRPRPLARVVPVRWSADSDEISFLVGCTLRVVCEGTLDLFAADGALRASIGFLVQPGSYALIASVPLTGTGPLEGAELVLTYTGRTGGEVRQRVPLSDLADLGLRDP
jgi:hemolysin type calcium-binding protein